MSQTTSHPHTFVHRWAGLRPVLLLYKHIMHVWEEANEIIEVKTFNNGSLGSHIDEERSEMR